MLPGTYGARKAQLENLPAEKGADGIGYQTVLAPVSGADDISGARRCQRHAVIAIAAGREKGIAIGRRDKLGATLAAAVGIAAAHGIGFAVSLRTRLDGIAFVARDDEQRTHRRTGPNTLEHMDR